MPYFPLSLGQMEEAEASMCSIRQKIQISRGGESRSTNAEINMLKPPNDICPASADPESCRKRAKSQRDAGRCRSQKHARTEGRAGSVLPMVSVHMPAPFCRQPGKAALVFSAMLLFFLMRKLVSTYSSPDGSLTVFPLMVGLHSLLSKL